MDVVSLSSDPIHLVNYPKKTLPKKLKLKIGRSLKKINILHIIFEILRTVECHCNQRVFPGNLLDPWIIRLHFGRVREKLSQFHTRPNACFTVRQLCHTFRRVNMLLFLRLCSLSYCLWSGSSLSAGRENQSDVYSHIGNEHTLKIERKKTNISKEQRKIDAKMEDRRTFALAVCVTKSHFLGK